jgi:zinc protease
MRRILNAAVLPGGLALAVVLRAAVPFPQADSDLRADPAARYGALPNGLRYVVLPNHEPKQRASMRLLVLAGSFGETESQRGLAHFLEHMAFNGSTHYAAGALAEKLRRLGMGAGADSNASTSFDRTVYQLELPDTAAATLADGLRILADYAGGLLIEPALVEKERGVILGEKRTRDTVGYRTLVAQLEFIEAGTRVPERLPIGLDSVIGKARREPLASFYNTWYRPELMAVIVVGDVDGAAIERQIVEGFSGLAPRGPRPPAIDLGHVADFKGVRTLFHSEPQAPDTRIAIASTVPFTRQPDTAARRIDRLPRTLAFAMLNRRLSARPIRGSASVREAYNLFREADVDVVCRPDQWAEALGIAEQELRRALALGFRPDELQNAVAGFRNDLEQAAKNASARRSEDLAERIADSLVECNVFTSPADDLALLRPALEKVSLADCTEALRTAWAAPGTSVFVAGNAALEGDANAAVAAAYSRSQGVAVTAAVAPPSAPAKSAWAYTDFGPQGAVASQKHVDDLDITEVTFANGVRLNLKKTDFEAGTVYVEARLGTGQLTEPAATEPGLSALASLTYSAGGLGRHSARELRLIFAGKKVGVQFGSTLDAFELAGQTDRDNLALEFQLLAASIADPGFRAEAFIEARKYVDSQYLRLEHGVRGQLRLKVATLLAGGDPRFGLPPREAMMARSLDEEKAWLAPELAHGALEVSVAGDFDIATAIDDAAKTIGTLPKRDPRPALDDLRKVSFPSQPFARDIPVDTVNPTSMVAVYWPTSDGMDVHRARRLAILADVLSNRLGAKMRALLGGPVGPSVASSASDILPGYGYIVALAEMDPAKATDVEKAVVAVAGDLNANGVTQEELDRVRNPLVTKALETERTNRYWMTVLGRAQERPELLDSARNRHADFESISTADIDALAKSYLAPEKASRVIIHPAVAAAPSSGAPPPPDAM